MDYAMAGGAQKRLEMFFDRMGNVLGNDSRRASFAIYAQGLLSDGERKSMEPIAARSCAAVEKVDAIHQRLGHFLTDSKWSDRALRREAASYALSAMTQREHIESWVLDDTGFLKQGKHSVGVQRQYTGSAGKITNCQIGVSLCVATRTEHLPIDFELYLPKAWTGNSKRRKEARIPKDVEFKTKPELALVMIDRALEDAVPRGVLLADEGYGNSNAFRLDVRARGLHYGVAINSNTAVWVADRNGKLEPKKWSARAMALKLGKKSFRRTTWREGTCGKLSARFAARRVVVAQDGGQPVAEREVQWLLMEWRDGDEEPMHFYLVTLPASTSRKQLVRIVKERYRTERAYQDLKGELGLDHFEGRRFPGWHHHISVALCCYAFITAERVVAFPPSTEWPGEASADETAPRATLRGFVHHREAGDLPRPCDLDAPMPALPSPPEIGFASHFTPPATTAREAMTQ